MVPSRLSACLLIMALLLGWFTNQSSLASHLSLPTFSQELAEHGHLHSHSASHWVDQSEQAEQGAPDHYHEVMHLPPDVAVILPKLEWSQLIAKVQPQAGVLFRLERPPKALS